jgi:hypothetical protein
MGALAARQACAPTHHDHPRGRRRRLGLPPAPPGRMSRLREHVRQHGRADKPVPMSTGKRRGRVAPSSRCCGTRDTAVSTSGWPTPARTCRGSTPACSCSRAWYRCTRCGASACRSPWSRHSTAIAPSRGSDASGSLPRINGTAPSPWVVGAVALVATILIMGRQYLPEAVSAWLVAAGWFLLVGGPGALVLRWSRSRDWGEPHRLPLDRAAPQHRVRPRGHRLDDRGTEVGSPADGADRLTLCRVWGSRRSGGSTWTGSGVVW